MSTTAVAKPVVTTTMALSLVAAILGLSFAPKGETVLISMNAVRILLFAGIRVSQTVSIPMVRFLALANPVMNWVRMDSVWM